MGGRGVNCIRVCRSCYFHLPQGVFPFPVQDWVQACVSVVTAAAFWHLPFSDALPCFSLELGAVSVGSVFAGHIACEPVKAEGSTLEFGENSVCFLWGHLFVLWSWLISLAPALHHPYGLWCGLFFFFFPWEVPCCRKDCSQGLRWHLWPVMPNMTLQSDCCS